MNKHLLPLTLLLLMGAGCTKSLPPPLTPPPAGGEPGMVCTQDAKLCPDGSYVSRTGPKCEFAPCPTPTQKKGVGTLKGKMTIGPICPVERPDKPCLPTPEMFAARPVSIYNATRSQLITTVTPDGQGAFTIDLPPGTYVIDVARQAVGSAQIVPSTVTITSGQVASVTINIDTGIR